MNIVAVYDSSVASAPAGYVQAIQAAISYLDAEVINNITITINFGWDEVNGQALEAKALGENFAMGRLFTYSQVSQALADNASTTDDKAAVAALPASDPTSGGKFFVSLPEIQALGLGSGGGVSGYIGLNAAFTYTFDPANRAVPHEFDAVGVLIHEITEIMGRIGSMGTYEGANFYTPDDLFRWSAPGVRDFTPGPGFFSIDGQTMGLPYNDPTNGGDASDWDKTVVGDSFGAGFSGRVGQVSATDLQVLDVLGYTLAGSTLPTPLLVSTTPAKSAADVALGDSLTFVFNKEITAGLGVLAIHDAGSGAVLETISIGDTTQVSINRVIMVVTPKAGLPAGASLYVTLDPGAVLDTAGTPFAGLFDATTVSFTSMSAAEAVGDWFGNALRTSASSGPNAALGAQLIQGLTAGTETLPQAMQAVAQAAAGTTSAAVLAYQFFTGGTPSPAGLDYLVSPTGPNPNNLNSAYYQTFSLENRYINFAVNLGTGQGAGAAAFAANYANFTLSQVVSQEYDQIFGSAPSAAKVAALIDGTVVSGGITMSRADYMGLYGGDGPTGLGAKAAWAGWLMAEGVQEGVGTYATAEQAYLSDLAQGHAANAINLIGYYHGTPYIGP
jgi:hypothetical protein